MKKIVLNILVCFLCFNTFSQDVKAKQILEEVRAHYDAYSFQADFSMEIDIPETQSTVMDGTLYLNGDQFKFATVDQTVISDNVNLWFWTQTDEINEVQISTIEETEDIISPSDVFGVYLQGFSYQLISETAFEGKNLALIEMIPSEKDDNNPYFKVKVVVNQNNDQLQQLQIFYKDGTVYTFKINNEKAARFETDFFTFDDIENPDTEVIDLR